MIRCQEVLHDAKLFIEGQSLLIIELGTIFRNKRLRDSEVVHNVPLNKFFYVFLCGLH